MTTWTIMKDERPYATVGVRDRTAYVIEGPPKLAMDFADVYPLWHPIEGSIDTAARGTNLIIHIWLMEWCKRHQTDLNVTDPDWLDALKTREGVVY